MIGEANFASSLLPAFRSTYSVILHSLILYTSQYGELFF